LPENMLSDRARSARSENLHPQTQMSCHIATFAKDPGPVVSCHVATFAKNLGTNDIDICPNPRDKYAHGIWSPYRAEQLVQIASLSMRVMLELAWADG
jgi:hypothetical protein